MRRQSFLVLVVSMASAVTVATAEAGPVFDGQPSVSIQVIPSIPGPYVGGEELTVDFWYQSLFPVDMFLTTMQFDFGASDPSLELAPAFTFDFSSLDDPDQYEVNASLPMPRAHNGIPLPSSLWFLTLPADDLLHVGSLDITLPLAPGIYRLDGINAENSDPNRGAEIRAFSTQVFGITYDWSSFEGDIIGGTHDFEVVPEPGAVTLLLLGSAIVLRRRRVSPAKQNPLSSRGDGWGAGHDLGVRPPPRSSPWKGEEEDGYSISSQSNARGTDVVRRYRPLPYGRGSDR